MAKHWRSGLILMALALAGCGQTTEDAGLNAPGFAAPEIEGPDQHGEPMKLSDFRGKVVMLDFWANWCIPCRSMYPHERSLVKKYKDRPFALLGVSSDNSREEFQSTMRDNQLDWRAWWNGDSSSEGVPVGRRYGVEYLPTVFLIDHNGHIRRIFNTGPPDPAKLDKAIEALLSEAEAARK